MFVVQRIVSLGHGLPSVNIFQSLVHANNTFKLNTVYFGQVAINTTCSILSLLLANCAFAFLITDNSWKWIAAYSAAFSFRMSHYFVSYLSQATMVSAGYISNENSNQKSNAAKHVRFFGYIVILPWDVEFPRSLVHVVVAWNVPMHCFLKQYAFLGTTQTGEVYGEIDSPTNPSMFSAYSNLTAHSWLCFLPT
ncbi:protein-serine O-palmitoleoyltransferase porcupine isoform X3 [Topomyia yanbarensis]|uniref:protein-serine O-palmitoleoyltransferase porcupine isoform X3 n=1 Tax=Topomyia yanbarensis TaxID=2498891 RepID=UPI00273C8F3B|nr:protein-serine O-palmitoleoyltransferase porcupine isoform X3 [Topomyia yanbarensis]